MYKKPIYIIVFLYLMSIQFNSYGAQNDSTITLIIFPFTKILNPDLDPNTPLDVRINNYERRIPKLIYKYLFESGALILLDRFEELDQLRDSVNDENNEGLINESLEIISDTPDAFLFSTIHKLHSTIEISAKIIDLNSKTSAYAQVYINFDNFMNEDSLSIKLKVLSNRILKQILPPSPPPSIVKPTGLDTHRFLNYSTLSSATLTLGSVIWYIIEDRKVDDNFKNYKQSTSVEDVTKFKIVTQKSLNRRKISKILTITSGVALGIFLVRDILWHPGKKPNKVTYPEENNPENTIKFNLHHTIQPNYFLVNMELSF